MKLRYPKCGAALVQVFAMAAMLSSAGHAQLGSSGGDLDGTMQRQAPCDDRLFLCAGDQGSPFNDGAGRMAGNGPSSANAAPSRSSLGEADMRYDFGTGQPLDASPRDYRRPAAGQGYPTQIRFRPEPLTEFQKFVAGDTGKVLPLFGSQLFRDVPLTFAPLDKVPVPANYVIGPGDVLLLRAWGSITFYLRLSVDRDGSMYIPHVGQIQVAGTKFSEMRDFLQSQISRSFKKFDLNVAMGQLRAIQVFVVGRTRRPGSYTIGAMSSLVDALFASGGPSSTGTMRRIEVKRGTEVITQLDLYSFLLNGDKTKDISLLPGDVIYDPPAGPRIALTGSVSQPAIYEIRNGETVGDLLAMAGGMTSLATLGTGELERIDSSGTRHVIEVRFDAAGLKVPLADGDILRVLSIVPRFDNAVTLRGNVANPGRYAWHTGMRITDLIPNKESLLTRSYWNRKNSLVFVGLDGELADAKSGAEDAALAKPNEGYGAASTYPEDEGNSGTLPASLQAADKGLSSPQNDPAVNADPNNAASAGSLASQTGAPSGQFPVANRVDRRVPDIDWDYAVVERLDTNNLVTSLKPFNLGRALLERDEHENLQLEPGDIITVFSQADIHVPQTHQTAFIRLEGEFQAAGAYSVQPGETLRGLVRRAGGLSPQAYLFGSSFNRESTRRQQQAQLDEYSADLERDIERAAATRSSSAVNVQEAATVSASLSSQRALVGKLRLLKATGRIVLDMPAGSTDLSDIPDLPLEDGDSFIVPPRPSNVKVVGAVYEQNAFLYKTSQRAEDYLQLAGGIARSGDGRHAFIIRADGSVVSRKSKSAHEHGGLEHLSMNPGDTFVVPEIVDKTTLLRGLTDWSAIIGQFALGAAAINVLH